MEARAKCQVKDLNPRRPILARLDRKKVLPHPMHTTICTKIPELLSMVVCITETQT